MAFGLTQVILGRPATKELACERIGPKKYLEHEKQILEETQTEIFNKFKSKFPKNVPEVFRKLQTVFSGPHQAS